MVHRLAAGALGLIVAIAIGVGLASVFLFYPSMPSYSGRVTLPGLSGETRVWRDSHGVPHIFAANWNDAARALGYIHASERLFQMEVQRRAGQGRLAEILGPDLVGVDRFVRALGLYRAAESSVSSLSDETRARLQAYADGVNAYLSAHQAALSPEFLLLHDAPEPWKPADSLVIGKTLSLQLDHDHKLELMRAAMARNPPPDQAGWMFQGLAGDSSATTAPVVSAEHSALEPDVELARWLPWRRDASNEWAVAGSRTTTGKPILANDPHLALGAPIVWFLARMVTPDGFVKGATVPGQPAVLLGQNDQIAWGFSNADTGVEDMFIETPDPADPSRYLTPAGARPFETRDEVIHVRGAADAHLRVRATRHGPVMSDVDPRMAEVAGSGKVIAVAFEALASDDTTSEAVMRLNVARDWNQFLAAMKLFVTPVENIVYADASGDIGFISPGRAPLRKSGDGMAPTDGASGASDWIGSVPFEQWPIAHNPAAGFIFNAYVPTEREQTLGGDREESFRDRRLQQFMDTIDKHSLETSAMMQADRVSLAALAMKPLIATIAPSSERRRRALRLLANWNGAADKDRPEPLIFNAFLRALRQILRVDKFGADASELGPFDATALISLVTRHSSWCDAPGRGDPQCRETLGRALDSALALIVARDGADMSKWSWGAEHVAMLTHPFYSHVPLLDRLSDLSVPTGGDFHTLDLEDGFDAPANRPFACTHGAGYRGIYDLSDPDKSRFVIATGESGHLFSAHYGDLVPLWSEVKSFPLAGSEAELRKAGAKELVFSPD